MLELFSLIAPILTGLVGAVWFVARGLISLKWTIVALLGVAIVDWQILEAANLRDPEAGAFGLFFVSIAFFVATILLLLGIGLRRFWTADVRAKHEETT